MPPLAYSYLRFSSAEQAKGDSIRRQTELRDAWLARSGAVLDTSITLRDEGVSAFTGAHRANPDRHALAGFLELVNRGRIPRGSYLIVESLDRLSREEVDDALELLLSLTRNGIRIVQLQPVEVVYAKPVDPMKLIMGIMELSRGYSESKMKSERIGRAWRELKRRAAVDRKPITPIVPAWLKVDKDRGKVVLIPERAAVVKRIYAMATAGHGMIHIANVLNAEKVPRFGKSEKWRPSTLHKILNSRAAVGECQFRRKADRAKDGDPIPGYFPAVVTEAQWWAAQKSLKGRYGGGRRTRRQYNPFSGLLRDARHDRDANPKGGRMYVTGPGKKANTTIVSFDATRGDPTATYVSFPLAPFAEMILSQLRELKPAELVGTIDADTERAIALRARVEDLETRRASLQQELESGEGEVKAAVAALRNIETTLEKLTADLAAANAKAASPFSAVVSEGQSVIDVYRKNDTEETRARLKAWLRRMVEEVTCLFVARGRARVGAVQVWFTEAGQHRDYLLCYVQGKGNAQKKTAATWWVRSWASADLPTVDLRDPQQAADLERVLGTIDPILFADVPVLAGHAGLEPRPSRGKSGAAYRRKSR